MKRERGKLDAPYFGSVHEVIATIPRVPVANCLVVIGQDYLLRIDAVKFLAYITSPLLRECILSYAFV
jgi:hypothetical protein